MMVESLIGWSRPEIKEDGRVMELKIFCLSILGGRGEANWVRLSATS